VCQTEDKEREIAMNDGLTMKNDSESNIRGLTGRVHCMDCLDFLRLLPGDSVDSCVTDPPYGLEFMDAEWDSVAHQREMQDWHYRWAVEVSRVLKPGAHLLAFSGTRTYHRLACAIEDAGFEIRDQIHWVYASGFPKGLNVYRDLLRRGLSEERVAVWNGWNTALKPAHEPIVVARKPLSESSVAENVLRWGTGGINIGACRIAIRPHEARLHIAKRKVRDSPHWKYKSGFRNEVIFHAGPSVEGRYPANLVLGHHPDCKMVDPGNIQLVARERPVSETCPYGIYGSRPRAPVAVETVVRRPEQWECVEGCPVAEYQRQAGQYPRFFYCPKASRTERDAGLHRLGLRFNPHITVKPVSLMRWLVRLVTPPDGVVLDPFLGSGTTAIAAENEGFDWLGCEITEAYCRIAEARIESLGGTQSRLEEFE